MKGRFWALVLVFQCLITVVPQAVALKPRIHETVTLEALSCPDCPEVQVNLEGQIIRFSPQAILELQRANRRTDFLKFFESKYHFDNEKFADATGTLALHIERIIGYLAQSPASGTNARQELGVALHAVQDFYSHTNWVSSGQGQTEQLLGHACIVGPIDSQPCNGDGGDLQGPAAQRLDLGGARTSGYFGWPDCCAYFRTSGTCIHGDDLTGVSCTR